jgi:hypothetical protein
MADNEVTTDLQRLVNLELPPKHDRWGRGVVKFTIACAVLTVLVCVFGLVFALRGSLNRESQLSDSLQCVRESSTEFDTALGEAVNLIVDMDVPITQALIAVALNDHDGLLLAVQDADELVRSADAIKDNIDIAIQARKTALEKC